MGFRYPLSIHALEIRNFYSLKSLDLDFKTVEGKVSQNIGISGTHGSGKSAVIEAIFRCLGDIKILPRRCNRDFIESDYVTISNENSPKIRLLVSENHNSVHWRTVYDPNTSFMVEFFSDSRSYDLLGPVKPFNGIPITAARESDRLHLVKSRIINERARRGFPQEGPEPEDEKWLGQLNSVWSSFHEDDGTYLDVQLVNEKDVLADLFILDKEGKRICSIDFASSAELELVSVFGFLLVQRLQAGVIVVDDLGKYFQQSWQRLFIQNVNRLFPDCQLIFTTPEYFPWEKEFKDTKSFLLLK